MNPTKLECIRLAIQSGAKEDLILVAKEIEEFISSSNLGVREPHKGIQRKDRVHNPASAVFSLRQ